MLQTIPLFILLCNQLQVVTSDLVSMTRTGDGLQQKVQDFYTNKRRPKIATNRASSRKLEDLLMDMYQNKQTRDTSTSATHGNSYQPKFDPYQNSHRFKRVQTQVQPTFRNQGTVVSQTNYGVGGNSSGKGTSWQSQQYLNQNRNQNGFSRNFDTSTTQQLMNFKQIPNTQQQLMNNKISNVGTWPQQNYNMNKNTGNTDFNNFRLASSSMNFPRSGNNQIPTNVPGIPYNSNQPAVMQGPFQ